MTTTTTPTSAAFINSCELAACRDALQRINDLLSLKAVLGLPALPETREAVEDLEHRLFSLRWKLLGPRPPQDAHKTA